MTNKEQFTVLLEKLEEFYVTELTPREQGEVIADIGFRLRMCIAPKYRAKLTAHMYGRTPEEDI